MSVCDAQLVKKKELGWSVGAFRSWVVTATALVFAFGIVLTVSVWNGFTFGLGSRTEKAASVTVALTFTALVFSAEAAILGVMAYWAASGRPDLDIDISFEIQLHDNCETLIDPTRPNKVHLELSNRRSRYAATHPGIRMDLRHLTLSRCPSGWEPTLDGFSGIEGIQWHGQIVHGRTSRHLSLILEVGTIAIYDEPSLVITLFADRMTPRTRVIPVGSEL